ncbi:hypothetical protein BC829DRAFT_259482 [Chytridium lagenaria]|nr:hypothetical protein BC829DRAFT_259482 [Chytridium lagenaria]
MKLEAGFQVVLSLATPDRPITLVLDALDELSQSDDAVILNGFPNSASLCQINSLLLTSSRNNPTLANMRILYPKAGGSLLEIPVLTDIETESMLMFFKARQTETYPRPAGPYPLEMPIIQNALYIQASWCLIAKSWTSEGVNLISGRSFCLRSRLLVFLRN